MVGGTCSSDARLKTNVQPFAGVLASLVRLQPVRFNWRASEYPEYRFAPGQAFGIIAQQAEKLFPEMVSTDARGYKMVNYSELPFLMLQGIRELKAQDDALRNQAREQQTELRKAEENSRAQLAEIQKLRAEVRQLRQNQALLASLEARLEHLEAREAATHNASARPRAKLSSAAEIEVARPRE